MLGPLACSSNPKVLMKCARRYGCDITAAEDEEARRWREKRPVRGKKKPSATTLARLLVVGFERLDSTAMRVENVREL